MHFTINVMIYMHDLLSIEKIPGNFVHFTNEFRRFIRLAVVINIIGWHGEWKICENLAFLLRIRICFREICFGCKTDAIASSIAVRLTLLLPIPSSPPFSNVIHWLMSTNICCEFWDRAENQQNNLLLFNYSNPSALLIWFNQNGVLYYIVTVSLWLL